MASLDSLYHETNRQLSAVHERMGELDRLSMSNSTDTGGLGADPGGLTHRGTNGNERMASVEKEIAARLDLVSRNCDRLDQLVSKEPAAGNRRMNAKVKVDQLKADVRYAQSSVESIRARQWQRERQARDRDELLSMRFTTNEQARSSTSGSGRGGGGGGGSDTAVLINAALEHNNRLERSNNYMNDLLAQGSTMLGDLRDQREMIKGFRRKLVDIAGVLGMSGTVMRLIERRQAGDKLVLIGGMVVTCIVMFIVLRYFT